MKKILAIVLLFALTAATLTGCGESPPASDSTTSSQSTSSQSESTPSSSQEESEEEEIPPEVKQLDDICVLLTAAHEEVAGLAEENGWTADETTAAELESAATTIETAKALLTDTPDLETIKAMIPVLETILSELAGKVKERVSVPYGTESETEAAAELVTLNINGISVALPSGVSLTEAGGAKVYSESDFMFSIAPAIESAGTAQQVTEQLLFDATATVFTDVETVEYHNAIDSNGMPITRSVLTGKNANGKEFTVHMVYCFPTPGQYVTFCLAYVTGSDCVVEQKIDEILASIAVGV